MKRPAFQFYPADWRKDMALQSCSVAARGLWVDMLCIAHECEPYGHLTVNGRPMTPAQIGRHTGLTERECTRLVVELEDAGVLSRTESGAIYSRRMVRDEEIRQSRAEGGKAGSEHGAKGAEHGKKGGRPRKVTGDKKPPLQPPPSSSSSSSTSDTPLTPEGDGLEGFAEFWAAWPKSPRKGGKAECEKVWRQNKLARCAVAIAAHVAALSKLDGWVKRGGEFVPAPVVYLRAKQWDGAELGQTATQADDIFAGAH